MIRNYFVDIKNKNLFLIYLWHLNRKRLGKKDIKSLSDKEAILSLYENYHGQLPNIKQPKTFSEKLQWLKLNYHNPLMTTCADKYKVREYLKSRGYKNLLNTVLTVYDNIKDFHINELPKKFILKATHGSGWNLLCTNKEEINLFIWKRIMGVWLTDNIFWPGREWPYKYMKPRIIAEKYLTDKSGQLMDFKFFCFNGKPKFIQANKGRDSKNHAQNFYDLEWHILPFGKDLKPRPDINIKAPSRIKDMIAIAADLSSPFPFVRVDFYEVKGKIIFGEMTFYPKSGLPDFTPPEYDKILGEYLDLPDPIA